MLCDNSAGLRREKRVIQKSLSSAVPALFRRGPRSGKLRRPVVIASLAMLLLACQSLPERPPDTSQLDELAEHLHSDWGFDGAFVVSTADGFRWEKGVGMANAQSSVPFTPETPTDGASLGKTFTAAAIHMLVEDGLLELDDPVAKYLPEFPYPAVTIRHLLSHSAGLPDYEAFAKEMDGKVSSNTMLLGLLAAAKPRLAFEPGTQFEYSSLGYDLAALVIERVSRRSYESYLREYIFQPLEMRNTFVRPARFEDWQGPRTVGYSIEGGMRTLLEVTDLEGFHGGSNVYASARDLDRWNRAWIDRKVLGFWALRRAMARAHFPDDLESGLTLANWYKSEGGAKAWYPGHLQGFYSLVFRDEQLDRSIVYVTNTNPPMWLRPLIVQAITRILDGGAFEPFVRPEFLAIVDEPAVLMRRHELPGVGGLEIRNRNGRRYAQLDGHPELRVFKVAPEVLMAPGYDAWLWFTPDGNGGRRLHWNTVLESVPAQ